MDATLYERDFHAWTLAQAAALRRLADRRENLDAALDLPALIEEVESLGRSQVAAVRSQLRRLFQHLIMIAAAPGARSVPHWRSEARNFRLNAIARFDPSMRQLVEPLLDMEWRDAVRLAEDKLDRKLPHLPDACPFSLTLLLDRAVELELPPEPPHG